MPVEVFRALEVCDMFRKASVDSDSGASSLETGISLHWYLVQCCVHMVLLCVCMCVCMYVCITLENGTSLSTVLRAHGASVCMYVCVYVCMYNVGKWNFFELVFGTVLRAHGASVCMCVCMWVCMYVCIARISFVSGCTCIHTDKYICTHLKPSQ
jgi:hypothetical protein